MNPMHSEKATLMRLKNLPRLFRKPDAEKVAPHAAVFLSRAAARGLVHRINRGNYINSFLYGFPGVEEVACFLRPPAYVSCEWALNYRGISLQVPRVCTVVTLSTAVGRGRTLTYQGIQIEFSTISQDLFFGFETVDNILMATAEKAVLDTLHLHKGLPAADELETDRLDPAIMAAMAEQYPRSVQRRLQAHIDLS
ncbi:MAG: hypothetical protein JEZ11_02090 [Desulfobacterales bacterium]|nr:hypothetical protein [Desulfobacterales bacterium]